MCYAPARRLSNAAWSRSRCESGTVPLRWSPLPGREVRSPTPRCIARTFERKVGRTVRSSPDALRRHRRSEGFARVRRNHPPSDPSACAHPGGPVSSRPLAPFRRPRHPARLIVLVIAACSSGGAARAPRPAPPPVRPPPRPASPRPARAPQPAHRPPRSRPSPMTKAPSVPSRAEPQRIVSLTPAVTETLFAIGAGPRVIATTDFDDYPPEAVALPDVATFQSVDVEKIVGMNAGPGHRRRQLASTLPRPSPSSAISASRSSSSMPPTPPASSRTSSSSARRRVSSPRPRT